MTDRAGAGARQEGVAPADAAPRSGAPVPPDHPVVAEAMRGLFGRDSVYLLLWGIQVVVAAGSTPVTTRLLGANDFGMVAAAVAVMQVVFVLAGCGLDVAVQRWFADRDGPAAAARLLSLAILAATLVTVVVYLSGPLWSGALGFDQFGGALRMAVLWAGASAVTAVALALLRSQDRLIPFAAVSLLQTVGTVAMGLALVIWVDSSAAAYLFGHVIAQALAVVVGLSFSPPRRIRRRDVALMRAGLAYALPLVPAALGAFVLNAADRLMVQGYLGEVEVGRYAVAFNIGSVPMLVLYALNQVWLPRLFAVKDPAQRGAVVAASRAALHRLLAPSLIGMSAVAPLLLVLWAPPEFRPLDLLAVTAIIIVSAVPFTAVQSATRDLLTRGATRAVASSTGVAAVANIGLNVVLIPVLGIEGAAIATGLAFAVQHAVLMVVTGVRLRMTADFWPLAQLLAAASVALLVTLLPADDAAGIAVRTVLVLVCLGWLGHTLRRITAGNLALRPGGPSGEADDRTSHRATT